MAPSTKGLNAKLEKPEHALQAIVLSDSYNYRFRPLTLDKPRCLLPLMNTPLIEYTFEFLALAGVQEVYVFCCAHADQVRDYIANSKWNTSASPFKVYTIVSRESLSVGDALRELDAKQLITSDFILVSGDVVSNVPLADVLAKHRARREVDKNSIMTMVVREASPYHRTRAQSESSVFVIDKKTQQCVHYEANEQGKKAISLDPQILSEHEELEIRNDLIDCQIDICSNDVPALFTENFDYQDIRKDFVYGVLTSDLLGKKIHCYVAKDHYAARVRSLQTYDAISKDVIARWTYPLVPDSNLLGQTFSYQRSQIYKEENVVLARSCVVRSKCLIGAYTTIGDATVVSDTVIGRNCTIGSNCKLEDTFLWENVSVGDNCTIQKAIIADGVTIGNNCTIEEGAVIASGVVVGNNVVIPGDMRLTIHESHSQGIPDDPELVGEGGHGLEYCAEEDSDEEELMEASGLVQKFSAVDIESSSDSDYSSSSEDDMDFPNAFSARRDSVTTMNSEDFDEGDFNKEAQQSLERAFEENHEVDIAVLELNTLRMAMNANYHEVRSAIVMALLKYMIALGSPIRDAVNKVMSRWSPLLARLTFNQDDQVDVMLSLQRYCVRFNASRYFPLILTYFYNEEVVDEDGFHQWYDDPRASAGENASLYNGSGQQFMEWLDTAESESSSEEEEEA
ncbi:translation initiation factor eIF2B epsilon subunit [Schizosaccharomyces japonicus yFS275]|uniref:Translation initiation factor eIF2B subunit epsilon n=1 Tax=Schizosaccharomyces japonicus (strain yFS275 / FY16936) TaxID=402676 RepID=B6K2K2_SCHJY|nr:translation initiation factor eIF2B epsilon subunit [Schizosaccharomyces japonicus yFS275]EEB07383.1 translation initiation factor eIF2B epsilon subunit [Schizosaccharomyces japonicus yFS275]